MREYALVALLMIFTVLSRTLFLYDLPYRVDGDAARFGIDGIQYLISKPPFFSTGWEAHTNAYIYLVGYVLHFFENDVVGIRALSALGGILGVLATYLMARDLFGKKVALWSAFFLSISPFHLVFSRNGMEVVWVTFFAPISMFFLFRNKWYFALIAGMFAGLAQYFTPISRYIPVMTIMYFGFLLFINRIGCKRTLLLLFAWGAGFGAVYAPMISHYIQHPSTYWARVDRVSIFSSEWFNDQIKKEGVYHAYASQFYNSYLAFHLPVSTLYPSWYFRTPLLDKIPIIILTIGLVTGVVRSVRWQFQWLILTVLVGIFFAGVLTVHSPMASRYTILFPFIACFIGVGMMVFQGYLNKIVKKYLSIIVTCIVFGIAAAQVNSYYIHETKDTWIHDQNSHVATYAGRYLSTVKEDYNIYFVGTDYIHYQAVRTLPFLTKRDGVDIFAAVDDTINSLDHTKRNFFIVVPSRESELPVLQAAFPNSKTTEFHNPLGTFLFWLVEV